VANLGVSSALGARRVARGLPAVDRHRERGDGAARRDDLVELPSRERFRRALERVGCEDGVRDEAAIHLSRAHMAAIADATVFPAEHAALSPRSPRYRIGVVSNFDDTATAYEILIRHGILAQVDTVVISEAVGLRKPHPALVRVGLDALGLPAPEVLFVGDTFGEDVAAAHAAGVDAAWIDVRGEGTPDTAGPRSTRSARCPS
jgi:putative hydrolase of the HAD superfamily